MKTREEFVRRWRTHLAGLALYGMVTEIREGPLARAARALDIPGEVDRILGLMYNDLGGEELSRQASTNGAIHRNSVS